MLNSTVTGAVGRQIGADGELGARIVEAMTARDDAVLGAAQTRDTQYMTALGTLITGASNFDPAAIPLVQDALGRVSSMLSAVQTAVTSVHGEFEQSISSFITDGSTFQNSLNSAASAFNSSNSLRIIPPPPSISAGCCGTNRTTRISKLVMTGPSPG